MPRTWKFSPEEVIISNKRGIFHTAANMARDSLWLVDRAHRRLEEAIRCLDRVRGLDEVLARQTGLVDPAKALEESQTNQILLTALLGARKGLIQLREAKIDTVEQIEDETIKIAKTILKKAGRRPRKKAKAKVVAPAPPKPVVEPAPALAIGEPTITLKLDPNLMKQARRELADRAKDIRAQTGKSELPDSSSRE